MYTIYESYFFKCELVSFVFLPNSTYILTIIFHVTHCFEDKIDILLLLMIIYLKSPEISSSNIYNVHKTKLV